MSSLSFVGARLHRWRGWHRAPRQAQLWLPALLLPWLLLPGSGTWSGRGAADAVTSAWWGLFEELYIKSMGLGGFGWFPARDDRLCYPRLRPEQEHCVWFIVLFILQITVGVEVASLVPISS